MSLIEKLKDFVGSLACATRAPDAFDPTLYVTYESNMDDLRELWAEIRIRLNKDSDKVEFIDERLYQAFLSFEAGEKDTGRRAILDIYNLEVKKFR